MIDTNEYITATMAASVIGVTRAMVHYYIRSRELPVFRVGPKAWLIRRIDAERLREKRLAR
jgi:hypothetical protein